MLDEECLGKTETVENFLQTSEEREALVRLGKTNYTNFVHVSVGHAQHVQGGQTGFA